MFTKTEVFGLIKKQYFNPIELCHLRTDKGFKKYNVSHHQYLKIYNDRL